MSGAPTTYTPELGDLICSLIAEGQSVRKICKMPDMPVMSTVMLWVLKGEKGEEPYVKFSEQYARSMEMRTDYWAEEIIDIADFDVDDEIFTEDGNKRILNGEFVARSRLRVDTRKWLMGKLKPKRYGEKSTTEITGKDGGAIETKDVSSPEDTARRLAFLLAKGIAAIESKKE